MSNSTFTTQSPTGDSGTDGGVPARSSLAALLASIACSIVAFGALPGQVQIHWTAGAGPYYGPEVAPKLLVVTLFPALIATLSAGAYWLGTHLTDDGMSAESRRAYRLAVLGTLGVVLGTQAFVILANVA